ncbi:MAG TPA: hypothetical protein V6D26_14340, partial [Stenomitos sp.]
MCAVSLWWRISRANSEIGFFPVVEVLPFSVRYSVLANLTFNEPQRHGERGGGKRVGEFFQVLMLPTPEKNSVVSRGKNRVVTQLPQPIWVMGLKKLVSPDVIAPIVVGLLAILGWDIFVRVTKMPPYLLPGPFLVLQTLIRDWNELFPSLMITLQITIAAFV